MRDVESELSWGVERRLEFIEFRLFWEGGINRADITKQFGVSVPQASKDLSQYQELAPGNMLYDKSEKRYFASESFEPRFLKPDADAYLAQLKSRADGVVTAAESWISSPPETDIALNPRRRIDIDVLREVLLAVRSKKSVEILYQSMNTIRPEPIWRRITPHAFGHDGFRWHMRAFCHLENKFKDFLVPRTLGVRAMENPGPLGERDTYWNRYFDIEIAPHPKLTASQNKVVAIDYGFADGKCVLSVRYAMLFYVLKRLGLLGDAEKQDPRRQHIVAVNKADVQTALEESEKGEIILRDYEVSMGEAW